MAELNDIMKAALESPKVLVPPTVRLSIDDDEPTTPILPATTVEVAGVKIDASGQAFAVPSQNVEDLADMFLGNPLDYVSRLNDPSMEVQFIRDDQLSHYVSLGCVPVTQKELGLPEHMKDEYGKSTDTLHRVANTVLIKGSKVVFARVREKQNEISAERLKALDPKKDSSLRDFLKDDGSGISAEVTHIRSVGGFTSDGQKEIG